jgi:hypothetical protein
MASSYKYLTENDKVVSSVDLTTTTVLSRSAAEEIAELRRPATAVTNSLFYVYGTGSTDYLGVSYGSSSTETAGYAGAAARIYKQYAHTLLGYKSDGVLKKFSDLTASLQDNLAFLSIPRAQIKDKVETGTFSIKLGSNTAIESGSTFEVQTGECRLLASGSQITGAVFYEAGIVVINSASIPGIDNTATITNMLSASNLITSSITNINFQAATELNSTVYFCRAYNNEFNFSSNPTYLSASQIIVKHGDPMEEPSSYITTVGLYDDNNQLLAVAKLSEPVKKTASTELIVRARLDF